jgi:hypothetical protein
MDISSKSRSTIFEWLAGRRVGREWSLAGILGDSIRFWNCGWEDVNNVEETGMELAASRPEEQRTRA